MNRLNPWTMDSVDAQNCFRVEQENQSEFFSPVVQVCLIPQHYESNYAYPLIVWLHPTDADERQLWDVMPAISARNYVAVAPRGFAQDGSSRCDWPQTPDGILYAECAVAECIERVTQRFHIAPQRVFIAGAGSGGTMALRVGLLNPHRFAGALSIGGRMPVGSSPLRNLPHIRQLAMWLAFRTSDASIDGICSDLRLLHSAGVNVMLRHYLCTEAIAPKMLSDINQWVMERVTGNSESTNSMHPARFGDAN